MAHILFFLSLIACATLLALVEIQVEGGEGWAAKLPTWKVDNRFTRLLMSGKPLTGYHTYMISFVFVIAHLAFGLGIAAWNLRNEARVVSFTLFLWSLEDFLWFILNPAWGLRRFRRDRIWWHAPTWWWFMPRDYWMYVVIGSALYAYSWGAL